MATDRVIDIFPVRPKKGEIGIEIEMEGKDLGIECAGWITTDDGSLRGGSREYVLSNPVLRDGVPKALEALQLALKANEATLKPSDRCGVHVHINCQTMTVQQVINFVVTWLIFEDIMVKFCGEDREGNLFCQRAQDSEYVIDMILDAQVNESLAGLNNNGMRYAAVNVTSLAKYGSVEFRSFRTPTNFAEIADWVKLLLKIKDASLLFKEPREIVEACSFRGATVFFHQVFDDMGEILQCKDMSRMIMNGVRRVQNIAYAPLVVKKKEKQEKLMYEVRPDQPGDIRIAGADRVVFGENNWVEQVFPAGWNAPDPVDWNVVDNHDRVRNIRRVEPVGFARNMNDEELEELTRLKRVAKDAEAAFVRAIQAYRPRDEEYIAASKAYNDATDAKRNYRDQLRDNGVRA